MKTDKNMKLFSPEDFANATEEEKEFMLRQEDINTHQLEGELDLEYNRVLDLLNKHDKDIKNPSGTIVFVNSKKIPFFNPNHKLSPEYLKFCEYSIFTSKKDNRMQNFKYEYSTKTWYTTKDNKSYFPIEIQNIPNILVHKRTEINKQSLKNYLSL